MQTELLKIDRENFTDADLARAGEIIRNGGLVAFPTETVYGLGGNAFNPQAASKIYAAKGRPSDNPMMKYVNDSNIQWQDNSADSSNIE